MPSSRTTAEKKKERVGGVDLLRGLAAFTVVVIHTQVPVSDGVKPLLLSLLPPANAVFALLAGYFMLEAATDPLDVTSWFRSRVRRIIVPYLVWTAVYVTLNLGFDYVRGGGETFLTLDAKKWLPVVFCGEGGTHLWFLPTLFYAQVLLLLIWLPGGKQVSKKTGLTLIFGVGVLACFCYPLIPEALFIRKLTFMTGYVFTGGGLVLLVPLLKHCQREIVCIAASALMVSTTCALIGLEGAGKIGIPFIQALSWVVLARAVPLGSLPNWFCSLGDRSMGIYLVHIVFTTALPLMAAKASLVLGRGQAVVLAGTAFVLSWMTAVLLHRLKVPGM